MDNDQSYSLLTLPKIASMPFESSNNITIRTVYQDLLGIWGLRKLPLIPDALFQRLNRQEMIYHPHFHPMKVTLIYCDALLAIKGKVINSYMANNSKPIIENAVCCFLYALYIALHGFGDRDYIEKYDKEFETCIDIRNLKNKVMLWSGITTMQGYHPVIFGLGTGFSDNKMAEDILETRIKYTERCIGNYVSIYYRKTNDLLFGMLYDFGMFYAYNEIMLALLQGSFSPDYIRIIESFTP